MIEEKLVFKFQALCFKMTYETTGNYLNLAIKLKAQVLSRHSDQMMIEIRRLLIL